MKQDISGCKAALPYNYHTHTELCDGSASLEAMVLSAIQKGMKVLGFSGHCYTAYDDSYCMSRENTILYKQEIQRLRQVYGEQICILCGIEQDFGSDEPTDDYDYVIGSVHAIFADAESSSDSFYGFDRNKFRYIDWSTDKITEAIASDFGGDPYAFINRYYKIVAMLPEVTGCDIIGHFDLVTKFNEKSKWFDESSEEYRAAVRTALDRIFESQSSASSIRKARRRSLEHPDAPIFEINTGAMSRGWRSSPYPAADILSEIRRRGGKIIINSDSHSVNTIDYAFRDAAELAKACGFNEACCINEQGFASFKL